MRCGWTGPHSSGLSVHYTFKRKMSLLLYSHDALETNPCPSLSACCSLKRPGWTVILHRGQPRHVQRFSHETGKQESLFSSTTLTWTACRQMQLSRCHSGLDGLLAHTTAVLLTLYLAQTRRSQFAEELNEIRIQGETVIHAFQAMVRCLSCSVLCPIQKILTE